MVPEECHLLSRRVGRPIDLNRWARRDMTIEQSSRGGSHDPNSLHDIVHGEPIETNGVLNAC